MGMNNKKLLPQETASATDFERASAAVVLNLVLNKLSHIEMQLQSVTSELSRCTDMSVSVHSKIAEMAQTQRSNMDELKDTIAVYCSKGTRRPDDGRGPGRRRDV